MARTLQNVIDRVRVITGDATAAQFQDSQIAQWATEGQLEIVKKSEQPHVDYTVLSVRGSNSYVVTGGFLFVHDVYYDGHKLQQRTVDDMDLINPYWRQDAATPVGPPAWYWTQKDTLLFYPTPDTSGLTILAQITARPADLVNNADVLTVPDEFFNTLVNFCLQKSKEWEEDWNGAGYFASQFDRGLREDSYESWERATNSYPVIRDAVGENW